MIGPLSNIRGFEFTLSVESWKGIHLDTLHPYLQMLDQGGSIAGGEGSVHLTSFY
jgi:hypothetical protein